MTQPDTAPAQRHVRQRRKASTTRRALAVVGVLALVLVGGGAGAALWFKSQLEGNMEKLGDPFAQIDEATRPSVAPEDADAVNMLVLGSDSRISAGDPTQWKAGAQRTDAIMLVHLAGDRQSAQVISIPRDSWVPIPGHGEAKINAAFSYGGPALMIDTVEQLTGVRIQHFAVTDFESFVNMTDALGGVEITIPEDISDGDKVSFTAGKHVLDGEQALAYARQRHGLANGDFGRVQRQQNWMRAIMAKVNNNRSNITMMSSFLRTVSESVATDDKLTFDEMTSLFMSARDIGTNDVTFLTAPYSGTGRSNDGQSIVVLDRARFDPLMAAIAADDAAQYVADNAENLEVLGATVK
ncbi:LCP family protein [Puerhibacterium puerhi]|uniref:LCP family protein n=1 Tax=Puerhibacterium puerhi TaxID=2692623 RepID=UPI001F2E8665|nr:LCP family protein [Puerhibacterium puerhi]